MVSDIGDQGLSPMYISGMSMPQLLKRNMCLVVPESAGKMWHLLLRCSDCVCVFLCVCVAMFNEMNGEVLHRLRTLWTPENRHEMRGFGLKESIEEPPSLGQTRTDSQIWM